MESAADTTWKGFSLAERDRRWAAVRANAAREGLDCILVSPNNEFDGRYLTDMQGTSIVLPTAGRTPIAVNDRGRSNAWLVDVRPGQRAAGKALAQALQELGMERSRIGVAALHGGRLSHVRAPEGMVNYTCLQTIKDMLPNATFEDGTDAVGLSRYVKGEEEIDALRRATAIAEAGIEEMVRVARPGEDAAVLYGRVSGRLLELGSEHYRHGLALTLQDPDEDEEPTRYTAPPLGRRLLPGTLITNEVNAVFAGLVAQEDQPILLDRIPEDWKPVIELQITSENVRLKRTDDGYRLEITSKPEKTEK